MKDDRLKLSRRNMLAGLGGVGLASAGAGLGTSAYLNDTESFRENTIAAGTLDLKVDWEEHYSYPQIYGLGDPASGLDVTRAEPDDPTGYVGLPDPENPMVWVAEDDLGTYMANTSIEAYPDTDDDGGQDPFAAEPGGTTDGGVGYICEDGADMDADLDPRAEGALRTDNGDTWDSDASAPNPLVNLGDVKPGDFGELTLSFHLCDNPGYVWLQGELEANNENGVSEVEAGADGEDGTVEEPGTDGELLDAVQARLWYDDGDNVVEVAGENPDDAGYLTPTLSLGELLSLLEVDDGVRLCPGGDGSIINPPAGDCPAESDYDSVHTTGDTVTVDTPLTDGEVNLEIGKNPKCTDFGLLKAVKTDEAPEGPLPESETTTYVTPYGDITVTTELVDGDQTITDWNIESGEYCIAKVVVKGGTEGANVYSYDNDDGDDDFTDDDAVGSMSDDDTELQTPTGQDISHVSFCIGVGTGDDSEPGEDSCCFEASTDHYLGLAWWLPTDIGNEIQSDSLAFDLGFYTEQCRHNDGAGNGAD